MHPVARTPDEWRELLTAVSERPFRAAQVFRWIHQRGVMDPSAMTDLGRGLRERLGELGLSDPLTVREVRRSRDGTRKLLLEVRGGGLVECVLIPMSRPGADEEDADAAAASLDPDDVPNSRERVTLCISTQHGCAMGCVFCASGRAGLQRGLGPEEIVAQVLIAKRYLTPEEDLRNLVFMGMGEPLQHYEVTRRAIELITHPDGLGMSPRRITVSSVGLVGGIRRLGEDFAGKVGLAISLHAPDNETRSRLIPINERYPVEELMRALRAYPLPRRRRITIEYTLIDGVNASLDHARRLAILLRGLRVKVNLIPMNPVEGAGLTAPPAAAVAAFRAHLHAAGVSCFVRVRRGDDVDAACGQLALKGEPIRLRRGRPAD
ncbi:MAG: 23S rRNA (adenine(2503)-C(2))-methyltransferase RlmN [Polyangiaceae bacterium]|nr:23S rRNA (adenine(2503)-C(2))-methyltransferase RlmN [Polyangiaceae bacterium]MCW5790839.1 23S rRNA (adenine(2503)-C(2))-methyltransferase RlmN [Polyangiaceae bacterium]